MKRKTLCKNSFNQSFFEARFLYRNPPETTKQTVEQNDIDTFNDSEKFEKKLKESDLKNINKITLPTIGPLLAPVTGLAYDF